MGIWGFTTFVNEHRERCFWPHQLQNTNIVIDGNSLACQLYSRRPLIEDCFGGDYNTYACCVRKFFDDLNKCNIRPIVLLDGNSDANKIETILKRNRDRVKCAAKVAPKLYRPQHQRMYPLYNRQLFCDLLLELDVRVFRCEFEADAEIAIVAMELDCPVLSQDSDFFIFDVKYIPFDNILQYPLKRGPDDSWYWECKMFRTQYLIDCYPGLTLDHLPMVATLLGNDYVKQPVFDKFCSVVKIETYRKRIKSTFHWLQNNAPESALTQILDHVDRKYRDDVKSSVSYYKELYKRKPPKRSKALKYLDGSRQTSKLINSSRSGTEVTQKRQLKDIPEWFMDLHYRGIYHQYFLQICLDSMIVLIPQLENYKNCSSHSICYPIISALNEILNSSIELPLKVAARSNNDVKVSMVPLVGTTLTLPKLDELPNLDKMRRFDYLFDILRLPSNKSKICRTLDVIPLRWRFYLLAIIYWCKFATPATNDNHVYSILVCALILKEAHNRTDINIKRNNRQSADSEFEGVIGRTPITEWQLWIELTKSHFIVNYDMYDVCILDTFAQLQTSALYIHYTNTLFGDILQRYIISDFYNGTFIYNFYTKLEGGFNFCDEFDKCPNIIEMIKTLFNCVKSAI